VIRGRLRRVLLQRFPYAVYYKVYATGISVVGVIHGRRHPNTWLRRVGP
jgi:toxin ParE1/3/4